MQNLKDFLSILICVDCGDSLSLSDKLQISCKKCRRVFPVKDDIPIFLPKEMGEEQKNQILGQQQMFDKEYRGIRRYVLENWRQSMLNRIFFVLKMPSSCKGYYADFGVGGTGYAVIEAAKLGYRCVGVDISLTGVFNARKMAKNQKVNEKILFLVATAEKLPFKRNSFQNVSSISVLEHLQKDREAIGELCRVTKERIFVVIPNAYQRIWFFLWPVYFFADRKIGHLRHYSEECLTQIFLSNNFVKEAVIYNGHIIKFAQLFFEKLLGKKFPKSWWWKMENLDLKNKSKDGVQLNVSFKLNA